MIKVDWVTVKEYLLPVLFITIDLVMGCLSYNLQLEEERRVAEGASAARVGSYFLCFEIMRF